MRVKMPAVDRTIANVRFAMSKVLDDYVMYKVYSQITKDAKRWNYYMNQCKELKQELAILANWLHCLLRLAGDTKTKARKSFYSVKELAVIIEANNYKLPVMWKNQSY